MRLSGRIVAAIVACAAVFGVFALLRSPLRDRGANLNVADDVKTRNVNFEAPHLTALSNRIDNASVSPDAAQAGVGIALRIEGAKVIVHKVLPSTPAARSNGIEPEDQVIAVASGDEEPIDVTGMEVAQVVGMIRGPNGTTVRLTIVPAGKEPMDLLVVSLTRSDFKELDRFVDGRRLPVGATAPDFRFTRLSDGEMSELSQLAGRIVVVVFWATWCGPCVRGLDELESLHAEHPEWNGQVELVAVNINEEKEDAIKVFGKKQWSRISTVWAGPDVLKSYRVSGLPTLVVIDQGGRVVRSDHHLDIPALLTALLRSSLP